MNLSHVNAQRQVLVKVHFIINENKRFALLGLGLDDPTSRNLDEISLLLVQKAVDKVIALGLELESAVWRNQ